MILVHEFVDWGAQSVRWWLEETDQPEHERHGQMCHVYESDVLTDHVRAVLTKLGHKLVCAESDAVDGWKRVEYWAPPEGL